MFDLTQPSWLVLLPLPALWLLWLRRRARRGRAPARAALTHTHADMLLQLTQAHRPKTWLARNAWLAGMAMLIVAMTQPRWLLPSAPDNRTGRDVLLALDVSGSMRAEDFHLGGRTANRLDVLKHTVASLLEANTTDRFGAVAFGDDVYTVAPLTSDAALLRQLIGELTPGIAGEKTALGDALLAGVTRLRVARGERILILFTDGSRTAGTISPLDALSAAKAEQVRIFVVGIGSTGNVVVPRGPREAPAVTDMPLDETLLRAIATTSGGAYFDARTDTNLAALAAQLHDIPATAASNPAAVAFRDWTWLPLLIGLALILGQRALHQRIVAP